MCFSFSFFSACGHRDILIYSFACCYKCCKIRRLYLLITAAVCQKRLNAIQTTRNNREYVLNTDLLSSPAPDELY